MADEVDWDALAAQVLADFAATGQWFASDAPPLPEPVDWDALAAQVLADFAATGRWFMDRAGGGATEPTLTRVSTSAGGEQGNGPSLGSSLSADGGRIAFFSNALNLVPGDANGTYDVFVKDLVTGAITLVSVSASGEQGNSFSGEASLSADGNRVAFYAFASNLVPGDANGISDAFVKDLRTGEITRVGASAAQAGTVPGEPPSLSADGSRVAFISDANDLVPGDTNGATDVFVKDLRTGEITRVSTSASGEQGNGRSSGPSLSADGGRVAFSSAASNLVPGDANGVSDVFVKDLGTGEVTLVSASAGGEQGNGASADASLSADGKHVAFAGTAGNLAPGDANGTGDVFVKDLATGAVTLASVSTDGEQGASFSYNPWLSADGSRVAFVSNASNLAPGGNSGPNVFVKDLGTGEVTLASASAGGEQGGSFVSSDEPSLSADGGRVAFESTAGNLVPGDTNGVGDVFVRDLAAGADLLSGAGPAAVGTLQDTGGAPFQAITDGLALA
jgi:Tol biopolymer transport system component